MVRLKDVDKMAFLCSYNHYPLTRVDSIALSQEHTCKGASVSPLEASRGSNARQLSTHGRGDLLDPEVTI